MSDLLVELGTEELPQSALDLIYRELADRAKRVLDENRIACGVISVDATPRRVVLFVRNVAEKQADQNLELSGPIYDKAFDENEKPTKAMLGFLKAKGATLKDVTFKETPKGKFVLVKKTEKGKVVSKIIGELIAEILMSVPFPKMMKWDASGLRFPRPIRWLMVLLGKETIKCNLADVTSEAKSYGHRFLSPKSFKWNTADLKAFQKELKKHHVILRVEDREALIRKGLQGRFGQKQVDEELIRTNAQLTEEPFLLGGTFSKEYLELPSEVLASCMKKNQKIFALYDSRGKLINKFCAVLNGKRKGPVRIRADYEDVLESRLKDARYFYVADTKESLESKLPSIEQITYLGKLGTMRDKTERMEKLAEKFVEFIGQPRLAEDLKRVARLSKIDLMTQLVFEMPDLQGIVGRDYALESGENEEVAKAIGTQYLPKNLSESHKELAKQMTPLGALFGILDRVDLLVGAFGTGIEPSGSQDPFALRRAGGSVIKLIRAFGFNFSLEELADASFDIYGDIVSRDGRAKLFKFFAERAAFELGIKPGTRESEIFNAVWNASHENLADVFNRFEVLVKLSDKSSKQFKQACKVVERTANILKGAGSEIPSLDQGLLQEPLERKLYDVMESKQDEVRDHLAKRDYEKATLVFGDSFFTPLNDFFDKVMVNCDDLAVRRNRHALMKEINRLYTEQLADLSLLSRMD